MLLSLLTIAFCPRASRRNWHKTIALLLHALIASTLCHASLLFKRTSSETTNGNIKSNFHMETLSNYNVSVLLTPSEKKKLKEDRCSICRTPGRHTTLIIAGGSVGSTWLGQLLHTMPCVFSFISKGAQADGKFREFRTIQGLCNALSWNNSNDADKFRRKKNPKYGVKGMIVPFGQLKALKDNRLKEERLILPPSLEATGVQVVIMTRNSFFWAISKAKKRVLKGIVTKNRIADCENWNQRGSNECPMADSTYKFRVSPKRLSKIIIENRKEEKALHALAEWVSNLLNKGARREEPYHVLRYEDLLCASDIYGEGALPPKLSSKIGLGNCSLYTRDFSAISDAHKRIRIQKSSPSNPCDAVKNIEELRSWARKKRAPWAKYFGLKSQSELVCAVK